MRRADHPHPSAPPGGESRCAGDQAHPAKAAATAPLADDSQAVCLDLARLLIPDPEHTVLLRVCGDSMQGAGIRHGDLLVVERRATAQPGAIVVARLGGCFTVKRLRRRQGRCWLEAAHPAYPPLDLEATARQQGLDAAEVGLWGVAVHVIHPL